MSRFPALVWALLLFAAWWAPPVRLDSMEWVIRLLWFELEGENLAMVALFNAMGVWPWLMAALLVDELLPAAAPRSWRDRIPALPFVLLANVLGMFVLGVYFLLRAPERRAARPRVWISWLGSPIFALVLAVVSLGLVTLALVKGDLPALANTIATEGFAWTMTFDFIAFWLVAAWWLGRRLGPVHAGWIPLVGTAIAAMRFARTPEP